MTAHSTAQQREEHTTEHRGSGFLASYKVQLFERGSIGDDVDVVKHLTCVITPYNIPDSQRICALFGYRLPWFDVQFIVYLRGTKFIYRANEEK